MLIKISENLRNFYCCFTLVVKLPITNYSQFLRTLGELGNRHTATMSNTFSVIFLQPIFHWFPTSVTQII